MGTKERQLRKLTHKLGYVVIVQDLKRQGNNDATPPTSVRHVLIYCIICLAQ